MRHVFRLILISLVLCAAPVAQAQTIPAPIVQSLTAQGFTITSKRFTWLGRIYVEASNGTVRRQILIARGSGQILQDRYVALDTGNAEPSVQNQTDSDGETKLGAPQPAPTSQQGGAAPTSGHADRPPPDRPGGPSGQPEPGGRP